MNPSRLALAFAVLSLLPAQRAFAGVHWLSLGPDFSCCEAPVRWAPRHPASERQFAIVTENGKATLILTRDVVALQLSDRTLHKVDRELRREEGDAEDVIFADAIKSAVISAVRRLLDHSAECPVRAIADADYRDGRIVFTTPQGDRVLEGLEINDRDLLETFSEADSRAFVQQFRLLKARRR